MICNKPANNPRSGATHNNRTVFPNAVYVRKELIFLSNYLHYVMTFISENNENLHEIMSYTICEMVVDKNQRNLIQRN